MHYNAKTNPVSMGFVDRCAQYDAPRTCGGVILRRFFYFCFVKNLIKKFNTDPVRLKYLQAMDNILETATVVTVKTQTHLYSELAPMYKKKYLQLLELLKEYQARHYPNIHKHLPKEKYLPEDKSRTVLTYYPPKIG